MKLTKLALFASGYIIGARAGRERYAQITDLAAKASKRLEGVQRAPTQRREES